MDKYIDIHTHIDWSSADIHIQSIDLNEQTSHDRLHSAGYHPWSTDHALSLSQIEQLENLAKQKNCIAIGECGLDKLQGAALSIQIDNFIAQAEIARTLKLPLIIHCVKAYNDIIQLKKDYSSEQWIIHGFNKNEQLGLELIRKGFLLSISPSNSSQAKFNHLPLEHIFLETDNDDRLTIRERYAIFAKQRQLPVKELIEKIYNNYTRVFKR